MAKQVVSEYDVENYPDLAEEYEAGDEIEADEYLQLTGNEDQVTEQESEEENEAEEGDEDQEEQEEDEQNTDFSQLSAKAIDAEYTADDLKEQLEARDLKVSGSKDELIERLQEA